MLELDAKSLRRGLTIVIVAIAITLFAQPAATPPPRTTSSERLRIDYVFLVDVSESMAGSTGHAPIFKPVIEQIQQFVRPLQPGTAVFVIPFAERVRETKEFTIRDADDIERLVAYLGSLEADGNSTAVYDSIKAALDLIQARRGEAHRNDRAFVLHVYTDGDDNVSRGWTLERILEHYSLARGRYDWLFYTELGLPRSDAKQASFSGRENVVYVSEKAGQVRPIVQVEALLPFLNFGNVVDGKSRPRSMKFAIRSAQALPPKLTMTIEPRFEDLRAAGVLAEIDPAQFPIDGQDKPLTLTMKNPLPRGNYSGHLKLTTSDPYVIVIPDEIGAVFSYEIPKNVRFSPSPGQRLPIDFGEVQPGSSATSHFRLDFDQEARKAGATVEIELKELSTNPAVGILGKTIYVDGFRGKKRVVAESDQQELTFVVRPPEGSTPGRYSGTADLSSDTATLSLDGAPGDGNSSLPPIGWQFIVPEPPTPWWVWVVIAVILIASSVLIYRLLNRPPTFTDFRLQILEPRRGVIDLAGQHSMRFGPSSQDLSDIPVEFTIRAKMQDRRMIAIIEADSSGVKIVRKKNKLDVFGSEELFAEDVIEVPPYHLRVESFALGSEDQG